MKRSVTVLVAAVVLSGCAHHLQPPASAKIRSQRCWLPVVKLTANEYDNPDEGASHQLAYVPDRGATLADVLSTTEPSKGIGQPKTVLVLSGGSLHGAFGAGLLYGWMNSPVANDEKVPSYDMITGVSTGALQSTFALLNTSPDPYVRAGAQRDLERLSKVKYLSHRLDGPTNGITAPGSSYLANLAQLYMPDRESDLMNLRPLQKMSPNKLGMLSLVGSESLATMVPLRNVIAAQLGDETFKGVAAEAKRGRKLFVAIGDLTNLYGYAADLTRLIELANDPANQRYEDVKRLFPGYTRGSSEKLFAQARQCYIDALVASSSVSPGVPPVAIGIMREDENGHIYNPDYDPNNPHPPVPSNRVAGEHIFVDGGAAFAVFFSQLRDVVGGFQNVDMDLIVNGSYFPKEWEKQLDKKGKTLPLAKVKVAPHEIALRSIEGLETQVRLQSVQEARRWVRDRGRFRWAFIDNRRIAPQTTGVDRLSPWNGRFAGTPLSWVHAEADRTKDCAGWKAYDQKKLNPMEFYPTYMRCIVSYGVARGMTPANRWNLCSARDPKKCEGSLPVSGTAD